MRLGRGGGPFAWLRPSLRIVVLGLGAFHAWVAARQQSMNEDGISYLDMGDACVRGDWEMALNAVWSPLYGCLLGGAGRIVEPGIAGELALVHAVNWVVFALALLAFELFWFREAGRLRAGRTDPASPVASDARQERGTQPEVGFSEPAWTLLGFTLFAWVGLVLIRIWAVTPDMLMAALLFLAAALWLRCGRGERPLAMPLALGAVLGLAYLAKAVMFPLALVFVGTLLLTGPWRRALPRAALGLVAFLVVAGPWVAALSISKERATFGDAGRLTYLRYVNGLPYPHWKPEEARALGVPDHPTRRVLRDPEVFEFASPVPGTYPPGYDPSYWYEGIEPRFDVREQVGAMASAASFYFDLFALRQGGPLGVVALLFWAGHLANRRPTGEANRRAAGGAWRGAPPRETARLRWGPAVVACVALAAYAIVYVEGRYVGAFLVLLWASLLSAVRLPAGTRAHRWLVGAAGLIVLFFGLQLAAFHAEGAARLVGLPTGARAAAGTGQLAGPGGETRPVALAREVRAAGLAPGEPIAFIGYAFGAYFARLAGLRIVAEVPWSQGERFWSLEPDRREEVLEKLRAAGAVAVVSEFVPEGDPPAGWRWLGSTGHLMRRLQPAPGATGSAHPKSGDSPPRRTGAPPHWSADGEHAASHGMAGHGAVTCHRVGIFKRSGPGDGGRADVARHAGSLLAYALQFSFPRREPWRAAIVATRGPRTAPSWGDAGTRHGRSRRWRSA